MPKKMQKKIGETRQEHHPKPERRIRQQQGGEYQLQPNRLLSDSGPRRRRQRVPQGTVQQQPTEEV